MSQKPGRPRKFSDEELHRRLIEAGIAALMTHGLSDGLDAVRLDAAIAESGVPRRAAYQHLETDTGTLPQEELRRQVLLSIFRDDPPGTGMEKTAEFAAAELEKFSEELASRDPARIESARREITRRVGNFNAQITSDLPWWAVYSAAASASATRRDRDPELVAAMRASVETMLSHYEQFYLRMARELHLKLRPEVTMRDFTVTLLATSEGLNQLGAVLDRAPVIDGDDGGWSALALCVDAMVDRCFISVW